MAEPLNYQPAEHFDPFMEEWGLNAPRSPAQCLVQGLAGRKLGLGELLSAEVCQCAPGEDLLFN